MPTDKLDINVLREKAIKIIRDCQYSVMELTSKRTIKITCSSYSRCPKCKVLIDLFKIKKKELI